MCKEKVFLFVRVFFVLFVLLTFTLKLAVKVVATLEMLIACQMCPEYVPMICYSYTIIRVDVYFLCSV